jgi:hypothetical protein
MFDAVGAAIVRLAALPPALMPILTMARDRRGYQPSDGEQLNANQQNQR